MKYSTKSLRIAGILAASGLVAGYSFHLLLNQGRSRDPSAEIGRKVEMGPMRETLSRAVDTVGLVGGLMSERQYGVFAAMADLMWLYDGHRANGVEPAKIASRKLNYGARVQEAYEILSGGGDVSPADVARHGQTLVDAVGTMRLQLRDSDASALAAGSSESNLMIDAKLGKRSAIVEGFEHEILQLAPTLMGLAARRAELDVDGFGLAYREIRESFGVEAWSSIRLANLQGAVNLGTGLSSPALRQHIIEVYDAIWQTQAPTLTNEMRSEATRNALLELYVVSALKSVENGHSGQLAQSWGEVYLRVSRAMARTAKAKDDADNQSFTQSTQEIVLAVRQGLESLMRADQMQNSVDHLQKSVGFAHDSVVRNGIKIQDMTDLMAADHELFKSHFSFIEDMMMEYQTANQARFDQIDGNLNKIYKSMFENFMIVKQALRVAKKDAEAIKASLRQLATSLDRMDRRLTLHLADSQNRLFNQTWERCVQRKANFSAGSGSGETMTYEKFQDCVSDFITYAADASKDSFNVDDANRAYGDLRAELGKPAERNLGFLARVGSEIVDANGEPVALDLRAYTDLPNWAEWNLASEAVLSLMQQYPEFGARLSEAGLGRIVDQGERLNRFATAITIDAQGEPRPALLGTLLSRHEKNLEEFFGAFEAYARDYETRAQRDGAMPQGMKVFAKSKADLADILAEAKPTFKLPTEISACPDAKFFQFVEDKSGVNLADVLKRATPSGKLAAPDSQWDEGVVSALSPYFLADHLGLGKVSSCVEGLKWTPDSAASSQAAVAADNSVVKKVIFLNGKSDAGLGTSSVRYVSDEKGERIEADADGVTNPLEHFGSEFEIEGEAGGKLTAVIRLHYAMKGAPALNIFPVARISYLSPEAMPFRSHKVKYVVASWSKVKNKAVKPVYVAKILRKDSAQRDNLDLRQTFSGRSWPAEFTAQAPVLGQEPDLSCLAENSAGQPGVSESLCGYFLKQRQRFSQSFTENMSSSNAPLRKLARKLDESQLLLARFVDIGMALELRADDDFRAAFEGSSGLRVVSERLMKGVTTNSLNPLQLRSEVDDNFVQVRGAIDEFFVVAKSFEWLPNQSFLRVETAIGGMTSMREKQLLKRQGTEKIEEAFDALSRRVVEEISKIKTIAQGN